MSLEENAYTEERVRMDNYIKYRTPLGQNSDLCNAFFNLRDYWHKQLTPDPYRTAIPRRLYYMVDHGWLHLESLYLNILPWVSLLESNLSTTRQLNEAEWFVLLSSAYLHDCGMSLPDYMEDDFLGSIDSIDRSFIKNVYFISKSSLDIARKAKAKGRITDKQYRKLHADFGAWWIALCKDNNRLIPNPELQEMARLVAKVVCLHGRDGGGKRKDYLSEKASYLGREYIVRVGLLAAIVAVADGCLVGKDWVDDLTDTENRIKSREKRIREFVEEYDFIKKVTEIDDIEVVKKTLSDCEDIKECKIKLDKEKIGDLEKQLEVWDNIALFEAQNHHYLRHITIQKIVLYKDRILIAPCYRNNDEKYNEFANTAMSIGNYSAKSGTLINAVRKDIIDEIKDLNNLLLFIKKNNPDYFPRDDFLLPAKVEIIKSKQKVDEVIEVASQEFQGYFDTNWLESTKKKPIHKTVGENEVVDKSAVFTNRHRLLLEKSREDLLNYINSFGKKHFKEAGKEIELDLIPQIVRCSDNSLLCAGDIAGKGGEHFLIFGEGGGGKSSVLLHLWQELLRQANSSDVEDYSPVPIIIPLSDLAVSYGSEGVIESIINRPLSLYLKTKTNFFSHTNAENDTATNLNHNYIQQEINYLSDCLPLHKRTGSAQRMVPFFVLLLDGYNELRTNFRAAVDAEIIQLSRQGANIQIILTTRHYISNALSAVFEDLELQGLTDGKVEKYLKSQNVPPSRSSGIIPLIRNPMILTLYCEGEKAIVNYEKRNNKTILFLKDIDSVSSILWNYIQLSVKLRGIWEPYSDLPEERERLYCVLNRILPELAWDMVSNGMYQISQEDLLTKLSDRRLGNIDYAGTKEIVRFLNEDVCLLTSTEGDDARVFFQHQNYRDFFAAVYITAAYDHNNKKRSIVRENIGTHILPFEIAGFVGELLNEHNNASCGDSILINIIREGNCDKNTIYNISQVYKALDLLDPTLDYFAGVDFSHINFINVRKELILEFVSKILSQIRHEEVIKEIVAKVTRQQHMAFPALNKVENALRISLMAATDSKPELTERFFQVWWQWVNVIYSYKAQIVSCLLLVGAGVGGKNEEQLTRTVEKVLQSEKKALPGLVRGLVVKQNGVSFFDKYIARKASSQIVHSIRGANLLQGEGHILTIFDEAEKKQRHLIILLDKLLEPPSVNDSLLEHIYEVARWNSIVANFVILNICYLLINALDKGFELVSGLYHKAKATDEPECIALVNWKIYSSINFTVQESKFKEASDNVNVSRFDDNKDFYISNFKPLMNSISADIVFGWINGERPERDYGLEYYFPLGVLAEFDITMGDNFTKRLVIESVFEEKGIHNISLLQRFIYETSCLAADSYHAKFKSYMEETFNTLTEIVEMIIPIYDMLRPGEQYALKYSLFEAFSILSYLEPVQTTTHFGELIRTYDSSSLLIEMAEKIEEMRRFAFSRGIAVDDDFAQYVSNPAYYVSDSLINGISVKDLVANCKNTWMVSDLGVSTLTQSDQARAYIGEKIIRDLLKNCNTYARAPEQFISSLILTILAELNKAPA